MFLCDFNFISEYFRKKGNFMTEEEEMKLEFERGLLDEEGNKKYEQYIEDKKKKQEEQETHDQSTESNRNHSITESKVKE